MLDWLFQRMQAAGDTPAVILSDQEFRYAWLYERVQHWLARLESEAISNHVVSLEADYSPEACAALLALIHRGAIVVPLTVALGEERRESFRQISQVQVRVRQDQEWALQRTGLEATHPLTAQLLEARQPGLVLFSTGSTGKPKAALHNFAKLLEKFKQPRHRLCTLAFLLIDHIGGQNTLFYTFANGGTLVSVSVRDPDTICRSIERHRVELLPTSPTFLNLLLLSEAYTRYDLSSLKTITYGTEPMPEATLRRIHQVFPEVKLLQTYGLSELGILRSKSRSSDSLWVKVGGEGFETRVVDGLLHIRARSAMLGYLNAPSPYDAEGWFNTQDEVLVDGDFIRILGRRSELINVGGLKVYPAEVESVLLELPYIADATVRGESNPITGQIVVARVTPREEIPLGELRKRIRRDCGARLESYKVPSKVEISEGPQHGERFKRMRNS